MIKISDYVLGFLRQTLLNAFPYKQRPICCLLTMWKYFNRNAVSIKLQLLLQFHVLKLLKHTFCYGWYVVQYIHGSCFPLFFCQDECIYFLIFISDESSIVFFFCAAKHCTNCQDDNLTFSHFRYIT